MGPRQTSLGLIDALMTIISFGLLGLSGGRQQDYPCAAHVNPIRKHFRVPTPGPLPAYSGLFQRVVSRAFALAFTLTILAQNAPKTKAPQLFAYNTDEVRGPRLGI